MRGNGVHIVQKLPKAFCSFFINEDLNVLRKLIEKDNTSDIEDY